VLALPACGRRAIRRATTVNMRQEEMLAPVRKRDIGRAGSLHFPSLKGLLTAVAVHRRQLGDLRVKVDGQGRSPRHDRWIGVMRQSLQ
jgi:hypothetical protein